MERLLKQTRPAGWLDFVGLGRARIIVESCDARFVLYSAANQRIDLLADFSQRRYTSFRLESKAKLMSSFYACFYHVVWATRYRKPTISPQIEAVIFHAIRDKSARLKCQIHGLNGTTDHCHVAVSVPPSLAVSHWVREVKGLSAHQANRVYPDLEEVFRWQGGYSVMTFGRRALPFVLAYIEKQKEHHSNNTIHPYLEYLQDDR